MATRGSQAQQIGSAGAAAAHSGTTYDTAQVHRSTHGNPGATLIVTFIISAVIAGTSSLMEGTASLIAPALAFVVGAWLLPRGTWTDQSRTRGVGGVSRIVSAVLLAGSWAVALGAAQAGWAGTAPFALFTLLWTSALAANWLQLRHMYALAVASAIVVAVATVGAFSGAAPVELLITGLGATGFMEILMAAGFAMVVSSVTDLGSSLDEMYERSDMRSLACTLGGATFMSMAAVIITSTSSFAPADMPAQRFRFTMVALAVLLLAGVALAGLGAHIASRGAVAPSAGLPLLVGLAAAVCGGWFAFTANGLSLVPALLFVLVATLFALATGVSLAAGLVRDGHVLRRRFARRRKAATSPRTTDSAPAAGLGPAHAAS